MVTVREQWLAELDERLATAALKKCTLNYCLTKMYQSEQKLFDFDTIFNRFLSGLNFAAEMSRETRRKK